MDTYFITGGKPLYGSVPIHGSKNSVLPILAATMLARGESVIHNCPALSDVFAMAEILACLGCRVKWDNGTMTVDATNLKGQKIPDHLMQEMRSSVLFLGPMLARFGEASMGCPGGCALGPRPIDLHLHALRRLGATVTEEGGLVSCQAKRLYGRRIALDFPSVGATENAMLAACGAVGNTLICNAAREPEIVDLQAFLRSMGARTWGSGGPTIYIERGIPLHAGAFPVMTDRIVAATYLSAVAAAKGEVEILGADIRTVAPVVSALTEAGCQVRSAGNCIWMRSKEPLRGVRPIYTAPYPGFPTDAQPMLMAALAGGVGETQFVETIFSNRYSHVEGLIRMGANIQLEEQKAVVLGNAFLHGAQVAAKDLRGGAALVVAALGAQGESEITGLQYMDRGYESMEADLACLGAQIRRMSNSTGASPQEDVVPLPNRVAGGD